MEVTEAVAIIFVICVISLGIVVLVRSLLSHLRQTKTGRLQAEIYNKMLDKFGSSQDLLAYLQTEAGQNLLKTAPPEQPAPHSRILNSVMFGVVATVLGLGILLLSTQVSREREPAMVIGTLILTLGVGFLAAAGASYVLSKRLGLLNGGNEPRQ